MTLIKTSLLNGVAVGTRLGTSLLQNKILAVYVGPSGYALIGQLQNVVSMAISLAGGLFNTGVTKYTAEYYDNADRQKAVWRTSGTLSIWLTTIVSLSIAIFHKQLSLYVLKDIRYGGVFLWFAVALPFYVFNFWVLAILNGHKDFRRYVVFNITASVVGLMITGVLAVRWGLWGALISIATNQSMVVLVIIAFSRKLIWFKLNSLLGRIDRDAARNLGKFVLMALTSTCVVPTSLILIRDHLIVNFGWEAAGAWQGTWKISETYLTLITGTLSAYYLPRLSEIRASRELLQEIIGGYKVILPITILGAVSIYYMRDTIIGLLFTKEFSQIRSIIGWQIAGDVIKVASWLLGYVLIAKAMVFWFIVTEVCFSVSFIILVKLLTISYGINGVSMAYLINYCLHLAAMALLVIVKFHKQAQEENV